MQRRPKVIDYFFIVAVATCVVPVHGMQFLREKVGDIIMNTQSDEETDRIFKKKTDEINAMFAEETNTDAYIQIRARYKKDSLLLHPDRLTAKSDEEIEQLLANRGVKEESYKNKGRDELLRLVAQELEKVMKPANDPVDKCNAAKELAEHERANSKLAYANREEKLTKHAFFIDLYVVGGLAAVTAATIAGSIKAWRLLKEYSSPNTILLEKMESAADKAVTLILNLEFDRYNPTKDTDALYMQFDIDALLAQLSSDEVRNQVKKAILAFDKTVEFTYEQCAWHYDNMTSKELVKQNPRLVREMQTKLTAVKEVFKLCRKDLKLDRNRFLDFFKRDTKKKSAFTSVSP